MKRFSSKDGIMTKEAREAIIRAVRAGAYLETAAAIAGVQRSTLYYWLREGARMKFGEKYEFREALNKALAEAEVTDVLNIKAAAQRGHWQASAWRLERRMPERWAKRDPNYGLIRAERVLEIIGRIVISINKHVKDSAAKEALVKELSDIGEEIKAESGES